MIAPGRHKPVQYDGPGNPLHCISDGKIGWLFGYSANSPDVVRIENPHASECYSLHDSSTNPAAGSLSSRLSNSVSA